MEGIGLGLILIGGLICIGFGIAVVATIIRSSQISREEEKREDENP